jgi:hypothetical protein
MSVTGRLRPVAGLGARAAVLMPVFKDTILSPVVSVQLRSNDMIRVGDRIEMPQLHADGDKIDIALHRVKVRNWDQTITTIPTYRPITESLKNWRGISERRSQRYADPRARALRALRRECGPRLQDLTALPIRHTKCMAITEAIMRKVQVFLREDQKAALKSLSTRSGQRQSDLIRKGIDLLIDRADREDVDWREATRRVCGIWRDRDDLKDLSVSLRAKAKRRFSSVYERT